MTVLLHFVVVFGLTGGQRDCQANLPEQRLPSQPPAPCQSRETGLTDDRFGGATSRYDVAWCCRRETVIATDAATALL